MRFTRWVVICVVVIGVCLCAARAADLQADATTKGVVSIHLPTGWQSIPVGRSLIAAGAPKADSDSSGQFTASISISQDAGGKVDATAQQNQIAKQMQEYHVIEPPTPVTISGIKGVMFGGSFRNGLVEVRSRQYMFAINNQIYTITLTSLNSAWAMHQALLEASIATFTVKQ